MTLDAFTDSLAAPTPPAYLSLALQALWHDGTGDWEAAHAVAQEDPSRAGSWVHAYLHRKEGDTWNANYWYRKAGQAMPTTNVSDEWKTIAQALLEASV